jgi:hypothetical protein
MITNQKLGFYVVKTTSIFIISVIYFIVGSITSILLNDVLPEEENISKLSTLHLILILSGIFGIVGVLYYFLRVGIKHMPFFLDGVYGFQYSLLKEASGGIIIAFIMYNYLDKLKILLNEFKTRIYKK